MISSIIKFYSGTTEQLSILTSNVVQFIAYDTTKKLLFWNHAGATYYLTQGADWAESDSHQPSYIKNKPNILTIQDLIGVLDVSQLADATYMITPYTQTIDTTKIVPGSIQGTYMLQLGTRCPRAIITPNQMHEIEPSTIKLDNLNRITLQLSHYMAYQNVTQVPNTWKLYYG